MLPEGDVEDPPGDRVPVEVQQRAGVGHGQLTGGAVGGVCHCLRSAGN